VKKNIIQDVDVSNRGILTKRSGPSGTLKPKEERQEERIPVRVWMLNSRSRG